MMKNILKNKAALKFLALITALILIWYWGRFLHIDTEGLQRYLRRFPIAASASAFILLYVVVTFFVWLSKDIFRLAGAIIFGANFSTVLVWLAEIINAFILFGLSRSLGRQFVEKTAGRGLASLDRKIARANLSWLLLMRGVPLVPFRFLDLAAGLSSISFKRYLFAVVVASPLRIFWVQYILAGVGEAVLAQPQLVTAYLVKNRGVYFFSLIYLVLAVVVARRLKIKG